MSILNLPAELLEMIFIDCVYNCLFRRIPTSAEPSTNPVELTHVCQLWRKTAISSPQLWASIHVNSANSEGDVKMFELWLQRSAGPGGNYPLVLIINQKSAFNPQSFGPLISLAIAERHRWKVIHLSLYGDCRTFFEPLFNAGPLPILRAFKIDFVAWDREAIGHLTRTLCSSPALESVHFGSNSYLPRQSDLLKEFVPWARQRTANFQVLYLSQLVQILSFSATSLQSILVLFIRPSDEVAGIPHVTARTLQSIDFRVFSGCRSSDVFDKLTLPSLQQLHLPDGVQDIKSHGQLEGSISLFQMLERSGCKLKVLTIGSPNTMFLESPFFNDLKTLKITWGLRTAEGVQLLEALGEACPGTQCPRLLPLLGVLTLYYVQSVDRVREIVYARIAAYGGQGRSKLRRVSAQRRPSGGYILDMDLSAV